MSSTNLVVFTIGHSNQTMESFLDLLRCHGIDVVADVRSHPFSKYARQFDQDTLKAPLKLAGIKYLYLGRELGGMPKEQQFYDDEGHVLYGKMSESAEFKQAMDRVLTGIQSYRVALMCGEEDPGHCHRRLLVGRVLNNNGITVSHIRGSGLLESDADLDAQDANASTQLNLFSLNSNEGEPWRSAQVVLRKKPELDSSSA